MPQNRGLNLDELSTALVALRERLGNVAERDLQRLEPKAAAAVRRLAEAIGNAADDPQALARSFHVADPQPLSVRSFVFPNSAEVEANENGFGVRLGNASVSIGGDGLEVESDFGSGSIGPDGLHVDTNFGSADVGPDGVQVETGAGSVTVDGKGGVTITGPGGREVNLPGPLPGRSPLPTPGSNPFDIPIPVPRFRAEPFDINISVPRFRSEPFDVPLGVPALAPMLQALTGFGGGHPLPGMSPCEVMYTPAGPLQVPIPYPNMSATGFPVGVASQAIAAIMQAAAAAVQSAAGAGSAAAGNAMASVMHAINDVAQQFVSKLAAFPVPPPVSLLEPPVPWVREIRAAVARAVTMWTLGARITEGRVFAATCMVPPGALSSNARMRATLRTEFSVERLPDALAAAVARVLADAWDAWFDGCQGVLIYPAFAAFPGPQAPPMPNIPVPLMSFGASPGLANLLPDRLEAALADELSAADDDTRALARQVAHWFSTAFTAWLASTQVMNVMARGPVPAFAPPAVPVGPVVGGEVLQTVPVLFGNNAFATLAG